MGFLRQKFGLIAVVLAAFFALGACQTTPLTPEEQKLFRNNSD